MRAACYMAAFVLLSVLVSAQRASSAGALSVSVTNLRQAVWGQTLSGDLWLYLVDEGQQAGTDLNGDGDDSDLVLHARSLSTGVSRNLGLAARSFAGSARLIALSVDEIEQGRADRNGDGDWFDQVLQVFDRATKTTTSLELASLWFQVSDERVAFLVSESAQGEIDRNGDGDAGDLVLHVYEPVKGVRNLGLAVPSIPFGSRPGLSLAGSLLAFLVDEADQRVDLNGDGTIGDVVMHVYDCRTGELQNLGLSLGQSASDALVWLANEELVLFGVREDAQGKDLNGDGDSVDLVPHVHRARTKSLRNLALASVGDFFLGYALGDSFAAFLVGEGRQGSTDLNGDGDLQDLVAFVYDEPTDELRNLGLAVRISASSRSPLLAAAGRRLAFQVSELAEGRDLDGDGDVGNDDENVLHLYDADEDVSQNLGLAILDGVLCGNQLAFRVSESAQGGLDLTGDGDARDGVLHTHDFRTGRTRSSGAAAAADYTIASDVVLFATDERIELVDQNGDGDALDVAAHVFGAASGAVQRLDLAIPRTGSFSLLGQLSPHRSALLSIPEDTQGFTDLNGDGDIDDWCLHLIEVREISRR